MPTRFDGAARLLFIVALLATALALACARSPQPRPLDPATRPIELEVLRLINEHRRARSLPPLREATPLPGLARAHSGDMARDGYSIRHDGLRDRLEVAAASLPIRRFSENIARISSGRAEPASWVVSRWLESPVHRDHIEGPFDLTGVGVIRAADGDLYFTQLFAASPN